MKARVAVVSTDFDRESGVSGESIARCMSTEYREDVLDAGAVGRTECHIVDSSSLSDDSVVTLAKESSVTT